MLRFISLLLVFIASLRVGESCSCAEAHPQQLFCTAQYAVKVLVLDVNIVRFDQNHVIRLPRDQAQRYTGMEHREFQVRVLKVYKGEGLKSHVSNKVYSAMASSLCGVDLAVGGYYYLMGHLNSMGAMEIGLCEFVHEITNEYFLTSRLLAENLLRNWAKGCGRCEVCNLNYPRGCEFPSACRWRSNRGNPLADALSFCAPATQRERAGVDRNDTECVFWSYDADSVRVRDGATPRKQKFRKRRLS